MRRRAISILASKKAAPELGLQLESWRVVMMRRRTRLEGDMVGREGKVFFTNYLLRVTGGVCISYREAPLKQVV